MSEPIRVSAREFERLQALKAMQETGQVKPPDSELRLKREMWETGKTVGKWYVGINLGVAVFLVLPILIAVLCGLAWLASQIAHQAAMTNDWMQHAQQLYGR